MALNPKAKPFVFNAQAADFTPQAAPARVPAQVVPEAEAVKPVVVKKAEPAKVLPESWEDEQAKPVFIGEKEVEPKVVKEKPKEPAPKPKPEVAKPVEVEKKEEKQSKKEMVQLKAHDNREHVNVVFIGHVDAGKSTISGQILLLTGLVDERTIQKYEKEAKERNRDSWYLAFIMDTNEEERAKGKTVEVGRANFETKAKRYTLLDAPGHKNYVPNMIGGAAQADIGVLIISARKGEFETGFDRGGQTREHAMLAKTLGVQRLVVAVNKMDDPTVKWSEERYNEVIRKLTPFLKRSGYNIKKDVEFLPLSGITGHNIRDPVPKKVCPWLAKPRSLLQTLDALRPIDRDAQASLRVPIVDRFRDMGALTLMGKIEAGTLVLGSYTLRPGSRDVEVVGVSVEEEDVEMALPGENVYVKVKGLEEEDVHPGMVLAPRDSPCSTACSVEAQVAITDLLEHKPIVTSGYLCVFHVHAVSEECQITELKAQLSRQTGRKSKRPPMFVKKGDIVICNISFERSVACEIFKDFPQLGRFTLRDEGKTIGIGKITKILS